MTTRGLRMSGRKRMLVPWIATVLALASVAGMTIPSRSASAAVLGDDYPAYLRAAAQDSLTDPWKFFNRECTSFVAWRLNNANHVAFSNYMKGPNGKSGQFGNANTWGTNAQAIGFAVNNTPAVGSVAWSNAGTAGHVAWVASVNLGGTVTIEEYNEYNNGTYSTRTVAASSFTGYIHISDMSTGPEPNTVSVARNADGRLEMFGVNTHMPDGSNNVFHAWQTSPGGAWQGWASIPGYLTSIAAATNADGRLEVVGANAHQPDSISNVYHAWQLSPGGSWSGWSYVKPGYLG